MLIEKVIFLIELFYLKKNQIDCEQCKLFQAKMTPSGALLIDDQTPFKPKPHKKNL